MQENEFEKQVKHLMEGFKPVPSGEAWAKINRGLKEKRRRRLPVFLLAAGLGAAGLLFYYTSDKQNAIQNEVAANNSKTTVVQDSAVVKDPGTAAINEAEKNNSTNSITSLLPGKVQAAFAGKKSNRIAGINKNTEKNYTGIISNIIKDNALNSNNADAALQKDIKPEAVEKTEAASQKPVNETGNVNVDGGIVRNDSSNTLQNNAVIAKPVLQNNKLPKWQWGVNASYGMNHAVKGLGKPEKLASQALYSPTAIISGDTVFNKHAYASSKAYSFGVEVQRSVSKNSVIAAGLNFTHLSTESNVRGVINANYAISPNNIVNNYYRPGIVKDYTNKYNFIELPVSFQQHLLQRKVFAFGYNAGFSVRQLLNSNSLIYNEESNIYFSNPDLLRKTQWQLQAGLNFKFNTGKSTSVYAGPQVSYSLSNFTKSKDNGNFHFMTYGLKAGLLFHKK